MDARAVAANLWRAFGSFDRDQIRGILTEDVEWIAPKDNATAVALGVTDHMIGQDAIADFLLNDLPKLFSNGIEIDVISITAEGSTVVYEQMQKASLVNGRHYENGYVFILEVRGARVCRIREYMDTRKGYRMVFAEDLPGRIVP
ncbi:nuclear transport factor 2 family protein [Nitratireductor thuwali]|uniref:SnoaL-like domain-containing protein n=1 Tax=Nitratireductor thuwali TaxID=2267699 RepID=A0ABY5MJS4_9HYPH|nr:hypothetical protein NTH_01488 [Nitratireductor thuwali]